MQRIETLGFNGRGSILRHEKAEKWDLTEAGPTEVKAGAALLLDVIEDLPNPGLALRNIADVLLPEGRLILTTPNPRWSASRLHYLIFGWISGFTTLDLIQNHHVFPVWPHILEQFLADAGLVIDEYVTLDGKSRLFRHRLSAARVLIETLDKSS